MCSERDWGSVAHERPVDRPGICCCSAPELIQIILRRVQILSFDDFHGGPTWRGQREFGACFVTSGCTGGVGAPMRELARLGRRAQSEPAQQLAES
jgi:hypothetical protein